ncbi:polysaccharide deacetylase family protein [Heliophilum fasciatum]|nr:polysaccharide deacetylase family protein [Heliophilum fasciatum]MCW2277888.1 putative sporulation protein (polysaccharide deacetylase family) [Heliophilum fasciatum]
MKVFWIRVKWLRYGVLTGISLAGLWALSYPLTATWSDIKEQFTQLSSREGRYASAPESSPLALDKAVEEKVLRSGPKVMKVALMVNVDWGEEYIGPLLTLLEQHQGRVTFFITGRFAQTKPEWVQKIHAAGHEIGNHGFSHPHPTRISEQANREELEKTEEQLTKITGKRSNWFAPPYGEYDSKVVNVAQKQGFRTVLWTVDTADWTNPTSQQWMGRVQQGIGPGALVLMHPTKVTVETLPELLRYCQKQGWQLVTLSELMQ